MVCRPGPRAPAARGPAPGRGQPRPGPGPPLAGRILCRAAAGLHAAAASCGQRFPAGGVGHPARHPLRLHRHLRRHRPPAGPPKPHRADVRPGGGGRGGPQPGVHPGALPPGGGRGRPPDRLRRRAGTQTVAAGVGSRAGHEQRPLPVAETGSCEWRSAPVFASIILDAQQKSAKRKRHEQRPLPVAETGSCEWRSAPVFASIILDAQQKSAKRKRAYVTASTASMCFTVCRSAGPEGEGGGFDSPSLPPLDTLPSPKRPGDVPLDPNAEGRSGRLAEKALYCASDVLRIAFSGRHPPCAPIVYARPSGAPAQRSQRNHD